MITYNVHVTLRGNTQNAAVDEPRSVESLILKPKFLLVSLWRDGMGIGPFVDVEYVGRDELRSGSHPLEKKENWPSSSMC